MTLEALASMIKVTPAKLEALEQGRYDLLPDANFTRALAMAVCRALKMDPGDVLAALPAARPVPLAEGKPPLNQPFKEIKGGAPLFDRHALNWSALLMPRYLAPLVLLLGAVLIYALPDAWLKPGWFASTSQPSVPVTTPVPEAALPTALPASTPVPNAASAAPSLSLDAAEPASAVASAAVPSTLPVQLAPQQTLPTAAPVAAPAAPPAAPPATAGALTVTATATSWLEVQGADGSRLFFGLVRAGENLSLDGLAPLRVRIGNVSGVQLRYQGQPVDLSAYSRNNVARIELK